MKIDIQVNQLRDLTGAKRTMQMYGEPRECPYCHTAIQPRRHQAYIHDATIEIVFSCTNVHCERLFIGYYALDKNGYIHYNTSSFGSIAVQALPEELNKISPQYVSIHQQAQKAEQYGLDQIAGMGYRKALEFLMKDYIIHKHPELLGKIESKELWPCIRDYVSNEEIKYMAQRAAWLGNDETHYVRKWEDKDITDLKDILDATSHWIQLDLKTEKYRKSMAEGKAK